jgi:hypothetical protein
MSQTERLYTSELGIVIPTLNRSVYLALNWRFFLDLKFSTFICERIV